MATAEHPLNAFMKSIFHTYLPGFKALITLIVSCKLTNTQINKNTHFFLPNAIIKHFHEIWIQ